MCRFSLLNNETICFYYSISSNFIRVEYHYDQIKYNNFALSDKDRHRFYIIFIIITTIIITIMICMFITYIQCSRRLSRYYTADMDVVTDSEVSKNEAAKNASQDGAVTRPILTEDLVIKNMHANVEDQ